MFINSVGKSYQDGLAFSPLSTSWAHISGCSRKVEPALAHSWDICNVGPSSEGVTCSGDFILWLSLQGRRFNTIQRRRTKSLGMPGRALSEGSLVRTQPTQRQEAVWVYVITGTFRQDKPFLCWQEGADIMPVALAGSGSLQLWFAPWVGSLNYAPQPVLCGCLTPQCSRFLWV